MRLRLDLWSKRSPILSFSTPPPPLPLHSKTDHNIFTTPATKFPVKMMSLLVAEQTPKQNKLQYQSKPMEEGLVYRSIIYLRCVRHWLTSFQSSASISKSSLMPFFFLSSVITLYSKHRQKACFTRELPATARVSTIFFLTLNDSLDVQLSFQLLLLIHTFSVFLKLKKLRWHNELAIDLSMSIPLVVTKRYEGQRVASWRQLASQNKRDPNRD